MSSLIPTRNPSTNPSTQSKFDYPFTSGQTTSFTDDTYDHDSKQDKSNFIDESTMTVLIIFGIIFIIIVFVLIGCFYHKKRKGKQTKVDIQQAYGVESVDIDVDHIPLKKSENGTHIINNPIVIIIGISDYSEKADAKGWETLDGVPKDYENVIDMFTKKWNYFVCYKNNDNEIVYTNTVGNIKDKTNQQFYQNFKLSWTKDEISKFCEQARDIAIKQQHNAILFVVSSHGSDQNSIIDSDGAPYRINRLYNIFRYNKKNADDEKDEDNKMNVEEIVDDKHLLGLPRFYFIDACRGTGTQEPIEKKIDLNVNYIKLKGQIQKNTVEILSPQVNEVTMFATVAKFASADHSENGGLFLRSVVKVFSNAADNINIQSKDAKWSDIQIDIKKDTRKNSLIYNDEIQFVQVPEEKTTLEVRVKFEKCSQ